MSENTISGGSARLFDVHRQTRKRLDGQFRRCQRPAAVRIRDNNRPVVTRFNASLGPRHVVKWIVANFQLETVDPFCSTLLDELRHRLRAAQRHCLIQRESLVDDAAQQRRDWAIQRLAQDIPASNIDRTLREFLPHQGGIHDRVDLQDIGRVSPDQCRAQVLQSRANPVRESWQVHFAQRGDFAPTVDAFVGSNADYDPVFG
ncbi:hypothetical protein D3C75_873650 [compost metagenome]